MLKSLANLKPPLKSGEPAAILVSMATPGRKEPLWFPGGWIVLNEHGWSIGPRKSTPAAFAAHDYDKSEIWSLGLLNALGAHPAKATLAIAKAWKEDHPERIKWRVVLYLTKRKVAVELGFV